MVVCHADIWRNVYKAYCPLNLAQHAMSACNLTAVYDSNSHQYTSHRRVGAAHSQYEQCEE